MLSPGVISYFRSAEHVRTFVVSGSGVVAVLRRCPEFCTRAVSRPPSVKLTRFSFIATLCSRLSTFSPPWNETALHSPESTLRLFVCHFHFNLLFICILVVLLLRDRPLETLFQSDCETSNSLPCPSVIIWKLYCFGERTIFHQHTRACLEL